MEYEHLLGELFAVARRLGVRVRVEPFEDEPSQSGAYCRIYGSDLILLDSRASLPDRVASFARALASLETDTVHTVPAVRALLDRYK